MVVSRERTLSAADAERLLRGPAAKLPPLLLATGEEAWLRDRLVAAFRAGGIGEGAEVRRIEGDEASAEELEEAFEGLPLFGAGVRIWIREGSKLSKAAHARLLEWAGRPGENVRVLVTTAREVGELKSLESLAAHGATVSCSVRPGDRAGWVKRMAEEAGIALPAGLPEAIAASAPGLLAASQEIGKLAALADGSGRVPPAAAGALRGAATEGSLGRWVEALLSGDATAVRREAAGLRAAGVSGTSALWAVAERALGSLEPGGFAWGRRAAGSPLAPGAARSILDAVYRADRALKRGELKDEDLMETLAMAAEEARRAAGKERIEA
jgi:DNA polymerase III delta subunit